MVDPSIAALSSRASALRRAGRTEEAISAYEQLLALRPELAESWYNLGWLQRQARRFEEALASYQQALDRGVSAPEEVHLNRAVILSDQLGRTADAASELGHALARDPDFVPALLNLGNLEEDLGQRDRARSCYERALGADPDNSLALARLGNCAEPSAAMAIAERLLSALRRTDINDQDRADLGFSLGRLLDAASDFDAAFAAYADANAANRRTARSTGHPEYRAERHEALIKQLIGTFARPVEASADGSGPVPLFICGMFRSGSSLAEQILASHSQVVAGGERDLIPAIIAARLQPYPESCTALGSADIDRLRRLYVDGMGVADGDDRQITDKRPDNFLHIGLIKTMFPTAKIIHTRRQPVDNILSLYFLHLDPQMAYGSDLSDAAHWYGEYQRLMAHWAALYPHDIFNLDYDALVANPQPVIERLLAFCGLSWDDDCLTPHRATGVVKTASVWQVREPFYSRSSGRWRNYATHLATLRSTLIQLDPAAKAGDRST